MQSMIYAQIKAEDILTGWTDASPSTVLSASARGKRGVVRCSTGNFTQK
jgi:hypothetical protein